MQENLGARIRLLAGGALVIAAGLASGCMSSPTYGTDKTANAQLMSDLSNITSINDKKRDPIDYSPRPELVKPAAATEALPPPQETITTASNGQWPESPEQRLARVRADATANQDNPNYDSPVVADMAMASTEEAKNPNAKKMGQAWRNFESGNETLAEENARKAQVEKRTKEKQDVNSKSRRYLSDPPAEYREAAADAPQGELGEDERDKERRLKKMATKNRSWWEDMNPF